MTEPSHAVFLSYASQDAEAAQKICEALRTAGIEVFLDQSELRGGDAWDQKIRHEIHDCALFIPMVSQHTQERLEGYFRHEWKLAIERTHHMAEQKPFLVPVVVDGTRDQEAFVPDAFRAMQWTRLPGGETPPAFVERIKRLLSPELSPMSAVSGATAAISKPVRATWRSKPVLLAIAAVIAFAAPAYFWISKHLTPSAGAFAPPPHSIAVLPFMNLSGDKEQEYFSDGLTEELLNSLAEINELQVAARTSSFSFKEHPDIVTVAHKLNVGAVLEGSVRRSEHTVRVTAQLINAVTGFHLWSKTYDRDLGDVLKLQTEIATAVANALKVTLIGDISAKIELGGTRNRAAYDAYLRASGGYRRAQNAGDLEKVISNYREAVRLDPNFALAYAELSIALGAYTQYAGSAVLDWVRRSQDPALKAIELAPDLAEGHLALAVYLSFILDFTRANEEYERAVALAPGNARVLKDYGDFAVKMGHTNSGLSALRRGVALDPLNWSGHAFLGDALRYARRYDESLAVYRHALSLGLDEAQLQSASLPTYYALGDFQTIRSLCEGKLKGGDTEGDCPGYLAVVYHKLGHSADAEASLERVKAKWGDAAAYGYAEIYAQWGNASKALEWLETAVRLRDVDLQGLKVEPALDPLRKEPRFQAIERELKFPD